MFGKCLERSDPVGSNYYLIGAFLVKIWNIISSMLCSKFSSETVS